MEKTIKCPICGNPYKFYAFSAVDQSACAKCVAEAERNEMQEYSFDIKKAVSDYDIFRKVVK